MLIDWFTVGAQALNFIILVWLMKRFLYKPILTAIDARESKIAAELAAAAAQQADAQKAHDEFNKKNQIFDEQRAALIAKAQLDAQTEHDRLLDAARREASDQLDHGRAAMQADFATLIDEMVRLLAAEVYSTVSKALNELASTELEERLAVVLIQRLKDMNPETRQVLGAALVAADAKPILRSRFVLGERSRATLTDAVNRAFSAEIHLRFETSPESDCGIELSAGGQRLEWGIRSYLEDFRARAVALMAGASAGVVKVPALATTAATAGVRPLTTVVPLAPSTTRVNDDSPRAKAS